MTKGLREGNKRVSNQNKGTVRFYSVTVNANLLLFKFFSESILLSRIGSACYYYIASLRWRRDFYCFGLDEVLLAIYVYALPVTNHR